MGNYTRKDGGLDSLHNAPCKGAVRIYDTAGRMVEMTKYARVRNHDYDLLRFPLVAKYCTYIFYVHSDSKRITALQPYSPKVFD